MLSMCVCARAWVRMRVYMYVTPRLVNMIKLQAKGFLKQI